MAINGQLYISCRNHKNTLNGSEMILTFKNLAALCPEILLVCPRNDDCFVMTGMAPKKKAVAKKAEPKAASPDSPDESGNH